MKAIMYHYVRKCSEEFPHFTFLHVEDFIKQIEYFGNEFGFVSKENFIESLRSGEACKGVVLTFDDALRDHYDYVYPILKTFNLWGIFYVPTLPFSDGVILDVHRIHLLLGKLGGSEALRLVQKNIDKEMLGHSHTKEYHALTYSTQNDELYADSKKVKRLLNYFVSYKYRTEVIDRVIDEAFGATPPKTDEVYLRVEDLNEMSDGGMIIGSHTVTHPVLSKLSSESQKNEITKSFSFLQNTLPGLAIKTFCYPHGGFHTFTPDTEEILEAENVLFSFNVEPRDVTHSDLLSRRQALPRYDCNQFPFGTVR